MKPSKPTNSATNSSPRPLKPPAEITSREQLRELQRVMARVLFRPLTPQWGMQKRWTDGSRMDDVAADFIKPNDRLSSFERLEIYNRQYWFRVLDCLWDDYPGSPRDRRATEVHETDHSISGALAIRFLHFA